MKKYTIFTIIAFGILICASNFVFAEEAQTAPKADEEKTVQSAQPAEPTSDDTEFSYGTVKSLSGDQLVISEYDYEADKDIDVTYKVSTNVQLENVNTLTEIQPGDAVDIDYLLKDGQKIASSVTVEKAQEADEDTALGTTDTETEPAEKVKE